MYAYNNKDKYVHKKSKLNESDRWTNIDKYRRTANIILQNITSKHEHKDASLMALIFIGIIT